MNLGEFFAMGGHAAYVWPAYAVALTVLIWNLFAARRSHRRALEEARRRMRAPETGP